MFVRASATRAFAPHSFRLPFVSSSFRCNLVSISRKGCVTQCRCERLATTREALCRVETTASLRPTLVLPCLRSGRNVRTKTSSTILRRNLSGVRQKGHSALLRGPDEEMYSSASQIGQDWRITSRAITDVFIGQTFSTDWPWNGRSAGQDGLQMMTSDTGFVGDNAKDEKLNNTAFVNDGRGKPIVKYSLWDGMSRVLPLSHTPHELTFQQVPQGCTDRH